MQLFLFRHAEAENTHPDESRELTILGEQSVGTLCRALNAKAFDGVKSIQHSTLTRAKQTAARFKNELGLTQPLVERDGLCPCDNPLLLVPELASGDADVMFVGHNPHLSILADVLMLQTADGGLIDFKKCGLLCLQRMTPPSVRLPYGNWALSWFMTPRSLAK